MRGTLLSRKTRTIVLCGLIGLMCFMLLQPQAKSEAWGYCYGAPAPRLTVNGQGRVTLGAPNALRTQPGYGYTFGYIPGGGVFRVVSGPQCANGYYWWLVNYNGTIGWTAEGQWYTYWLEPLYTPPTYYYPLPTRLHYGSVGQVTPGLPNVIRTYPSRTTGVVFGYIPAGGTFTALYGPYYADGYVWWLVNYNGSFGFTVESGQGQYYVNPL